MTDAETLAPKGFMFRLTRAEPFSVAEPFLNLVADVLTTRGFSGTLTAAPETRVLPQWLRNQHVGHVPAEPGPVPSVFIEWTLDLPKVIEDPYREARWEVPDDATDRIVDLAEHWSARPGFRRLLRWSGSNYIEFDPEVPSADLLADAIKMHTSADIDRISRTEERYVHVAMSVMGKSIFQTFGEPGDWARTIDLLRQALTALPADLDVGFIRPGAIPAVNIDLTQDLPGIEEYHIRENKHLLGSYLPDAHGIQVITTAHLQRITDLTRWAVTDLGHDRYLVEAKDLAPWYAQPLPDPKTVERARADFGEALLTTTIVAENPPPWRGAPTFGVDVE